MKQCEINGLVNGCLFDMCASEGSPIINKFRCAAYEKMNGVCLALAARRGFRDWHFNWRQRAGCGKLLDRNNST